MLLREVPRITSESVRLYKKCLSSNSYGTVRLLRTLPLGGKLKTHPQSPDARTASTWYGTVGTLQDNKKG